MCPFGIGQTLWDQVLFFLFLLFLFLFYKKGSTSNCCITSAYLLAGTAIL
jgi:hypothetical protein